MYFTTVMFDTGDELVQSVMSVMDARFPVGSFLGDLLRDQQGFNHSTTLVTVLDHTGFPVNQNPASVEFYGHIAANRLQQPRNEHSGSFWDLLFADNEESRREMLASVQCTSDDRISVEAWEKRMRVRVPLRSPALAGRGRSPLTSAILHLHSHATSARPAPASDAPEYEWHIVEVLRLRDVITNKLDYVVTQTDVSAAEAARQEVRRLRQQHRSLIHRLLPPHVAAPLLETASFARVSTTDFGTSLAQSDAPSSLQQTESSQAQHQPQEVGSGNAVPERLGADNGLGRTQGGREVGEAAVRAHVACEPGSPDGQQGRQPNGEANGEANGSQPVQEPAHVQAHQSAQFLLGIPTSRLARYHPCAAVLYADIKGFTKMSQTMRPRKVMRILNRLYTGLDTRLEQYGVHKVETIGDCYVACAGLDLEKQVMPAGGHYPGADGHQEQGGHSAEARLLAFARAVLEVAAGVGVIMRVGLHVGPVMSGVVGQRMPRFCLLGSTMAQADRVQTAGPPERVAVSAEFAAALPEHVWEALDSGEDSKDDPKVMLLCQTD